MRSSSLLLGFRTDERTKDNDSRCSRRPSRVPTPLHTTDPLPRPPLEPLDRLLRSVRPQSEILRDRKRLSREISELKCSGGQNRTDGQAGYRARASERGRRKGRMRVDRFFGNPVKIRRRRCGRRKDGRTRTTQMGGEIRPFKDRLTKPSSFLPIGNPKPPASPSLSASPLSFCPSQGILISWDFRNWVTRG